ncbi:MAG: hypothetical protein QM758_09055 [Armatimonas sp.]
MTPMQDSYDDDVDSEKAPGDDNKKAPAQRIPDELPPVRIGEVGKDKPGTPEHQENLRERSTDPGFDTDDTIDGLPVAHPDPDTQIDEILSDGDPEKKTDNRPV